MSIKSKLPEWMFKRKRKYPDAIEVKLEVKDAFGRTINFSGCWDWETEIKKGMSLHTGRTSHDMTGAAATVTIGPPK